MARVGGGAWRRRLARAALAAAAAAAAIGGAAAALVHEDVAVAVDAGAGVARVQVSAVLRNDGPGAVSAAAVRAAGGAGALLASRGKKVERKTRLVVGSRGGGDFEVALGEELGVGEVVRLAWVYEVLDGVRANPTEIREGEDHFVELVVPGLFESEYRTEKLKVGLKVSGEIVDAVVEGPAPVAVEKKGAVFGPFEDLPPMWQAPVRLRYKSNAGMLVAREAVREMYISHWGNIAAKEEFRMENVAAAHVGRWSRVDYDKGMASKQRAVTAVADVWAHLPPRSTNVVYKDLVGNITTSRMRKPNAKHLPVQLSFRYPMLGGWKNHFWYTYDIPLSDLASSLGMSHRVKVPIYPSIDDRFLCRRLVIRVLLPEGAKNVAVEPHGSLPFSVSEAVKKTTLNFFGRSVVTLEGENVVANVPGHGKYVYVTYDFAPIMLLGAPLLVASGIFAAFLVFIVYAGADFRLLPEEEDPKARAAALVTDQHIRFSSVIKELDTSHEMLDALFTRLVDASDSATIMASRLTIEGDLKREETELDAVALELKSMGSDSAEIAGALVKRFAEKRDLCMRAISSKLMLLEGRMSEEKYVKQVEGTISTELNTLSCELDALAEALFEHM